MIWRSSSGFLFFMNDYWVTTTTTTCSSVNSPQPYSFPQANKKLIQEHENVKEQKKEEVYKIIESLFYVAVRVFEITEMFCGKYTHFFLLFFFVCYSL